MSVTTDLSQGNAGVTSATDERGKKTGDDGEDTLARFPELDE